ncbi:hypothetical protein BH09SUM1_BH09SUM1_06010 [soil metagenome]
MSRFSARIATLEDAAAWQRVWARSERHAALHWRWAELAALAVGTPVRLVVTDAGGEVVAAAAFVERRRRFLLEWRHPAPLPFAGVLCDPERRNDSFLQDVFSAIAVASEHLSPAAELILQPNMQDARGLLWAGWDAKPHYNFTSRIDAEDSLERAAENAARRQGQKARAGGLKLEESAALLPEILQLWKATRERHKIPAWVSDDCFQALAALPEDMAAGGIAMHIFGVRAPDGPLQSGAVVLRDSQRAYYLLGGSAETEEGAGSGAPTLLQFELTAALFRKYGPFLYDWVGANTPSVAQFKKKFRPELEFSFRCNWRSGKARWLR